MDWGQCFGDEYYHSTARAVEVLPNGNIVTSILATSNNAAYTNCYGGGDSWVVIFDSAGNIIKERCLGGSNAESFKDIEICDEYIYFVGQTLSSDGDVQSEPIGGYYNVWIVKTDFDLNIIWEKQYGCLGTQSLSAAKLTPEGGLTFVMDFGGAGGGDVTNYYGGADIWVCEIDANGELLWEKTLGNAYDNYAENLFLQEDGSCLIMGETMESGGMVDCDCHGMKDIWVMELDAETHEINWQGCYGGSDLDIVHNILPYEDGYLLVGSTMSSDGDISYNHSDDAIDGWLLEIDNSGELIWEHCFGGTRDDGFRNIYSSDESKFLIFGHARSLDGDVNQTHCPWANCHYNTWVLELDENKEIIWNKVVGPEGYDSLHELNGIKRVGDRDFIIAGLIHDSDNHTGDVDCDPYPINNGQSTWVYRLYDPNTVVIETTYKESLSTYPNPAKTQIIFELPLITEESTVLIRDVLGQNTTLLTIIPSQQQMVWDCSGVPTGVYFYQVAINEVIYMGKVVVM